MSIDSIAFLQQANHIIRHITDTIEQQDIQAITDIDTNDTTITIHSSYGTFIINRHQPSKQIWLSSPISGPHRFSYYMSWTSKSNQELLALLSRELNIKFN